MTTLLRYSALYIRPGSNVTFGDQVTPPTTLLPNQPHEIRTKRPPIIPAPPTWFTREQIREYYAKDLELAFPGDLEEPPATTPVPIQPKPTDTNTSWMPGRNTPGTNTPLAKRTAQAVFLSKINKHHPVMSYDTLYYEELLWWRLCIGLYDADYALYYLKDCRLFK